MKRVLLIGMAIALSGCGAREGLVQAEGKPMPATPYAAKQAPTAESLLKPEIQTRPARSDDLIQSSEERRSDEFDLPPPN